MMTIEKLAELIFPIKETIEDLEKNVKRDLPERRW